MNAHFNDFFKKKIKYIFLIKGNNEIEMGCFNLRFKKVKKTFKDLLGVFPKRYMGV